MSLEDIKTISKVIYNYKNRSAYILSNQLKINKIMFEILEKPKVKAFLLAAILLELYLILPFESTIITKTMLIISCLAIYYKYRIWKIEYRINIILSKLKATDSTI